MRPGGSTSCRIERAVIDLPQPLSPTRQSVCPVAQREVDAVDRLDHALVGVEEMVFRPLDLEEDVVARVLISALLVVGVGRVAQPVAEEVEGQHRRSCTGDARARRAARAPWPRARMFCASCSSTPQLTTGGRRPRPRKRQRRLAQDHRRDRQRDRRR